MTEAEAEAFITSLPTDLTIYQHVLPGALDLRKVGLNRETELPLVKEILDSGTMNHKELVTLLTGNHQEIRELLSYHNFLLILRRVSSTRKIDTCLDVRLKDSLWDLIYAFNGLYKLRPRDKELLVIPDFSTVEEVESHAALVKLMVVASQMHNVGDSATMYADEARDPYQSDPYYYLCNPHLRELVLEKPESANHIIEYIQASAPNSIHPKNKASINIIRKYVETVAAAPALGSGVL
jgi:hypothetical protein